MNRYTMYILAAILLVYAAAPMVASASTVKPEQFAAKLESYLRDKDMLPSTTFPSSVRVLPLLPGCRLDVAGVVEGERGAPVWLISGIEVAGRSFMSYRSVSWPVYNLSKALDRVFSDEDMYSVARETFYATLMVMREGVPENTYDPVRPPGILRIDIPTEYSDLISVVKPELLLVMIGFTDENITNVRGLVAIYYFAFIARVVLENGFPAQAVFVVAVAVDPDGVLYKGMGSVGAYVTHVLVGGGTGFGFFQVLLLYGGIGVFLTAVSPILKPDDRDKYYLVLFAMLTLQLLSLVILVAATRTSVYTAFGAALYLKQWLVFLLALWLPAYLMAAYYYYSSGEEREEEPVSELLLTPAGVLMKVLPIVLALMYFLTVLIIPDAVLLWLSSYMGAEAFYVFFLLTALSIAYIGIELGRTAANVAKWRKLRSFY